MDEKRAAAVVIFLFAAGLFFLGKGITAFAISESCCFGDDCSKDDVCDAARLESPTSIYSSANYVYVGGFLSMMSVALYLFLRNRITH